jgi:hypothetical protein
MVFWALKTFDQLPKSIGSYLAVDQIFRSTENETFDQLKKVKKHNFDQVKFDQVSNPQSFSMEISEQ